MAVEVKTEERNFQLDSEVLMNSVRWEVVY